jgi:phosphopantothenoylcysteine decarboxylase / phosphopantothenate---cysteine ligase
LREVAPRAVRVGFAAETGDLERHGRRKLERKGADFLVANDVSRSDIAFGADANEVVVFRREGPPVLLPRRPKSEIAGALLDLFTPALLGRERPAAVPAV